jgi:hypothetical protein
LYFTGALKAYIVHDHVLKDARKLEKEKAPDHHALLWKVEGVLVKPKVGETLIQETSQTSDLARRGCPSLGLA